MNIILAIIIGYLLGSIPFALLIGKLFYKTDVRQHGSGNLGASNTGRVLGKKAAIGVIIGDVGKVVAAIALVSYFDINASIYAGVFAALGHCYPLFAQFKGGKAVATMFGFLLGVSIFTFSNLLVAIIPLIVFVAVLYITKMVSISSIFGAISSNIYIIFLDSSIEIIIASILLTLLVIYRHKDNFKNIKNGTERKITWM